MASISFRYDNPDLGTIYDYPVPESIHYRIQDGQFELWYVHLVGDSPETMSIGPAWTVQPERAFIRIGTGAGIQEYPITLPPAELMMIMDRYSTERAMDQLVQNDSIW